VHYLLISVLIWATSLDEHFFLVAHHCALYCFVVNHFYVVVAQMTK